MHRQPLRAIAMVLVVLVGSACGTGAPPASPSPSALTFDDYAVAFCSAWETLFQAVGNPDTAMGSVLSKSLDDAVAAGDVATAERLSATITSTLELARRQAAVARRWPEAGPMMAQLDRVIVAYEAMIAAKRARAANPQAANPQAANPQAAFEQAGGVEAWTAMLQAAAALARPAAGASKQCATVPVTP